MLVGLALAAVALVVLVLALRGRGSDREEAAVRSTDSAGAGAGDAPTSGAGPDSSSSTSSAAAPGSAPEAARADMPPSPAPHAGGATAASASLPRARTGAPPILDAAALVALPAAPPPVGQDMAVVRDPVTGEMRSPTAEEIRNSFPELREPPGSPPLFDLPGGGIGADLSAGFGRSVSVATWSQSEGLRHHCMQADCPHPSHVAGATAPASSSAPAVSPGSAPAPTAATNSSDPAPESPR